MTRKEYLIPGISGVFAAIGLLLALCVASCAGRSWDRNARIAIVTTAHGVDVADTLVAQHYQRVTDEIAARDGGLRNEAYLAATSSLDRDFTAVMRARNVARATLLALERALDHYQNTRDVAAACAFSVHLSEGLRDVRVLVQLIEALHVGVPPDLLTGVNGLQQVMDHQARVCAQLHADGATDG